MMGIVVLLINQEFLCSSTHLSMKGLLSNCSVGGYVPDTGNRVASERDHSLQWGLYSSKHTYTLTSAKVTHTVKMGKAGRGWRVSQAGGRRTLSGVVREERG